MENIFSTAVLVGVVQALDAPASFLLDTFFPTEQTDDRHEEIHFDVDKSRPRITPFVSPLVAGKVVASQGFETKVFKPAYAKDKRVFMPNGPLRRMIGEAIGGEMTPMQRREARLAFELEDQLRMLTRREEVMASEAMRTGKVTVAGEQYPTTVVDYGRDAALTVTLAGGARWGQAGVKPMDLLEAWAGVVQTKSGAVATNVVMDPKAWALFRVDADVKALLDLRRGGNPTLEIGPMVRGQGAAKARYVGKVGDFDIWVYQDIYVDENNALQQVLPDYTVIVSAGGDLNGVSGVRAYGMIQDEEAQYKATRYFPKSWLEKDPPVRFLLLQSAPLVVPYRVNATLCATVN